MINLYTLIRMFFFTSPISTTKTQLPKIYLSVAPPRQSNAQPHRDPFWGRGVFWRIPSLKQTLNTTWKWMVGIRSFPFARAHFQVLTVRFRECNCFWDVKSWWGELCWIKPWSFNIISSHLIPWYPTKNRRKIKTWWNLQDRIRRGYVFRCCRLSLVHNFSSIQ